MIAILVGCGEKDVNKEVMKELAEIKKHEFKKDLTSQLNNKDTEFVGDALELRDICNQIMEYAGQGDIKTAFEEMKKYSFMPDSEMDSAYIGTQKQIDIMQNRFGKFTGYELVEQQLVSDSLVRFVYLAKCENHPLVWRFLFYKSEDKWTLNNFTWDDLIQNIR